MEHSGLGVIECRSKDSRPGSLLTVYAQICEQHWTKPHAFSAAVIGHKVQFGHAWRQVAADPDCTLVCVAGHGKPGRINLYESGVTAKELLSLVEGLPPNVLGLHLSTCSTLTPSLASDLLRASNLRWVSGYQYDVGWMPSLATDTYLLPAVLDAFSEGASEGVLGEVARKAIAGINGVANELGLSVHLSGQFGAITTFRGSAD